MLLDRGSNQGGERREMLALPLRHFLIDVLEVELGQTSSFFLTRAFPRFENYAMGVYMHVGMPHIKRSVMHCAYSHNVLVSRDSYLCRL